MLSDIKPVRGTKRLGTAVIYIHNFTSVRTDRLHKAGGGLITLIRDNITFTTTDIPSTINTHNIELQMVKVHINNTKHITIAKWRHHKKNIIREFKQINFHLSYSTRWCSRIPSTTQDGVPIYNNSSSSDQRCKQPCRCPTNGIQRRSNVVKLSG